MCQWVRGLFDYLFGFYSSAAVIIIGGSILALLLMFFIVHYPRSFCTFQTFDFCTEKQWSIIAMLRDTDRRYWHGTLTHQKSRNYTPKSSIMVDTCLAQQDFHVSSVHDADSKISLMNYMGNFCVCKGHRHNFSLVTSPRFKISFRTTWYLAWRTYQAAIFHLCIFESYICLFL